MISAGITEGEFIFNVVEVAACALVVGTIATVRANAGCGCDQTVVAHAFLSLVKDK